MAKEETFGFIGGTRSVELRMEWGNSTLGVVDLDPPRKFTIGNTIHCDHQLPIEPMEVIRVEGDDVFLLDEMLEFDVERTIEIDGVVSCVVNSFRGLSFPAPEEGIVTVGYSIQLSPG